MGLLAAFILAIVFTIITIAGAIVILRRRFKTSTLIKVLTTIVFPFVAIFCWLYMILNTTANFDIITSLYSSFLITLGFFGIVVAVYFITLAIIKKKKEKDLAYMKSLETEVEDLEKTVSEMESAKQEEQENEEDNNEVTPTVAGLIENNTTETSDENVIEVETNEVTSENAEENNDTETNEVSEENEEVQQENEEKQEESEVEEEPKEEKTEEEKEVPSELETEVNTVEEVKFEDDVEEINPDNDENK
mgnify:CR=1 FL=1